MPYEPRWPESEGERTEVLPVVMPGDVPPDPVPEPSRRFARPRLRRAGWVAGGVFGVLLVAYLIDLLTSQGSVPRGVTVAGVDVGGLDRPVAERELRSQIEPRLTQPLTVTAGAARSTLSPTLAGLRLDWSATLDQAGDQPVNPFIRLSSFFTSREIGVVSHAEADKLDPALEDLRGRVDHDAVEGTVRFEGATPVAVPPQAGQKLDVAAAKRAVLAGWASGQELALPVVPAPVRTTAEGVQTALEQFAKPAVAAPVTIKGEGADATLQPKDIAAALSFEPAEGGGLTPKIDPKKITDVAGPQLKASEKEGKEATVGFSGGQPVVEPSVDGKAVDWEPSLKPLPDALKRADQRELKAVYKNSPAKVTTEQANQLGVKEVVGEFTTGASPPTPGSTSKWWRRR